MLRKLWNRTGPCAATMTSRSRVDYRTRLNLEPLEQRRMLAVVAVFDTTIDDNEMELDRDGEFRLFIYGDEPVMGAEDRDDTIDLSAGISTKAWSFKRMPLNTAVYAMSA